MTLSTTIIQPVIHLPVHVAAGVLQAPVFRHVVIAVPVKVYPVLQAYVDLDPVVPVVAETVPKAGLTNVGEHELAAKSLPINIRVLSKRDKFVQN